MNHLYYGDNLSVLRESIPTASVDLIYLDPPFNSNAGYNILFKGPQGHDSAAQIEAFDDTWHWTDSAEEAFGEVLRSGNGNAAEMLRAMRSFLGENDMMAYLAMMAVRLLELHRVLKPTGSLYLHCDPTASHYLKILLDAVFGARNFRNEIIWQRAAAKGDARTKLAWNHDVLLCSAKTDKPFFRPIFAEKDEEYKSRFKLDYGDGRGKYRLAPMDSPNPRPNLTYEYKGFKPPVKGWRVSRELMEQLDAEGRLAFPKSKDGRIARKHYHSEQEGRKLGDVWTDIPPLQSGQRMGYPTDKPPQLLERIVSASSNEGDVVLDPFCGCGTTVHAAQKLGRQWIGIDVTHLAIGLIEKRLRDAFETVRFTTHGVPQDLEAARDLARRGRENKTYYFEFEKWALSLVAAQPGNLSKKGADRGIDGNIYFAKTSRAIVSVKAGDNVGVSMIRDLVGTLQREKAEIGVFLTLTEPTKPMLTEAASAGLYEEDGFAPVPRVQIVTIEEALKLRDRAVRLPARRDDGFKRAAREEAPDRQGSLDI